MKVFFYNITKIYYYKQVLNITKKKNEKKNPINECNLKKKEGRKKKT